MIIIVIYKIIETPKSGTFFAGTVVVVGVGGATGHQSSSVCGGNGIDDGTDENAFGMDMAVVCVALVVGCYTTAAKKTQIPNILPV